MKRTLLSFVTAIALMGLFSNLPNLAWAQAEWASPNAVEGVEELTRGPIHEAFANPVTDDVESRLIIPKAPPPPIAEEPAELRPEEEGVVWIPGYWAWDADREDFLWISGVWRVAPPNQRWTPGYWVEYEGGFVWVSGFWAPTDVEELRYYAPPPDSLETGPSSPAPGDDYFWITGSWIMRDADYRWQPGTWARYRPEWAWTPTRWVWTPAGYVCLPGHWDHPWMRRGCLYTPVYFTAQVYRQPGFTYRPYLAVNLSNTLVHLWVRPNYRHYYFGNYYAAQYRDWGITPWCDVRQQPRHYDPLFAYYQARYRREGVDYAARLSGWHEHYVRSASERPPSTWREQAQWARGQNLSLADLAGDPAKVGKTLLALPNRTNADLMRRIDPAARFAEVSREERTKVSLAAGDYRKANAERAAFESHADHRHDFARERVGVDKPIVRAEDKPAGPRNAQPPQARVDVPQPDLKWKLPKVEPPLAIGKPVPRQPDNGDHGRTRERPKLGDRPSPAPSVGVPPSPIMAQPVRKPDLKAEPDNPRPLPDVRPPAKTPDPTPRNAERPAPQVLRKPEVKPEIPSVPPKRQPEAKPEIPSVPPKRQPEAKPEIPSVPPKRQPEAKPEIPSVPPPKRQPEVKPEIRPSPAPAPKPQPAPAPKPQAAPAPKPQAEPRKEVRPEKPLPLPDVRPPVKPPEPRKADNPPKHKDDKPDRDKRKEP